MTDICCGHKIRANLIVEQELRFGSLNRCSECGQRWHEGGERMLYGSDRRKLTKISERQLKLILAWNESSIALSAENEAALERIGPNPAGPYSLNNKFRSYPCRVQTTSGDWHEHAVVHKYADAPADDRMSWRLGSEIAVIEPSPDALPLQVRNHMGTCGETHQGYFPCHLAVSSTEYLTLNLSSGIYNFFVSVPGYDTKNFRGLEKLGSHQRVRPPVETHLAVNFIVDGHLWHPTDYDVS